MSADERTRASFDEYAQTYADLHAASISASGESTEYFARYKLEALSRLGISRDDPVLDYGCGIGNLTEQLVRRYSHVHAFDPSEKCLEVARTRAPAAIFHADADRLPSRYFRVVVLAGVLHHVANRDRVALLRGIRERLTTDGKLAIFEHNPLNPLTRRAIALCEFDRDAILLGASTGTRLARQAGFAHVDLRYIVFFPRFLAMLRRWEPKLGWLPLGAQWMLVAS
jgi:2-polyprenyl-3-methyl-5-hydroxy-6-metoxy-1,4-benzoquinol methylase